MTTLPWWLKWVIAAPGLLLIYRFIAWLGRGQGGDGAGEGSFGGVDCGGDGGGGDGGC